MTGISRRAAILAVATAGAAGILAPSAGAVVIPVTNLNDSGGDSLRAAITTANGNGPGTDDVITFTATGQINLLTALPSVGAVSSGGRLAIQGPGSSQLDIHRSAAAPSFPVISALAGADLAISGVRISGGDSATSGGGILTSGAATATRVEISGNQANVGGAGSGGGAATLSSGVLTIRDSTVSGNQSGTAGGGGVTGTSTGTVTIERSTISGNSTTALSGAGLRADGAMIVRSTTIASNTAPGGTPLTGKNVVVNGGTLSFENSIVADAESTNPMESAVNCQVTAGNITSLGFNMVDDASCNLTEASDHPNVDPALKPLALNTSPFVFDAPPTPTLTHALPPASPAVDQGSVGPVTGGVDQRGLTRPEDLLGTANPAGGDGSDIGAFELQVAGSSVSGCGPTVTTTSYYVKHRSCAVPFTPITIRCKKSNAVNNPVQKCKKKKKKKRKKARKKK